MGELRTFVSKCPHNIVFAGGVNGSNQTTKRFGQEEEKNIPLETRLDQKCKKKLTVVRLIWDSVLVVQF